MVVRARERCCEGIEGDGDSEDRPRWSRSPEVKGHGGERERGGHCNCKHVLK